MAQKLCICFGLIITKRDRTGRIETRQAKLFEPARQNDILIEKQHIVTPRPDARSSVVKYRNVSEFEATGFRVKRGMTINRRFLKKLNEYKTPETSAHRACKFQRFRAASAP